MQNEEFAGMFKTKEVELPEKDPEELCEILFTSGTTGVSKGVMISQKNIPWTQAGRERLSGLSMMWRMKENMPASIFPTAMTRRRGMTFYT